MEVEQIYGLIGYPLIHSFSKTFFNEKFESEKISAEYINFEISDISLLKEIIAEEMREQVQDSTPNRFRTEANGKRKHKKEASLHREASFLYRK